MEIKSLTSVANKWKNITSQRSPEYEQGVRSPRRDWATSTEAARDNYNEGVTLAITQDRFTKGVRKAGTATWSRGAIEKGVSRFASGVRVAEAKYREGFQPYHDVISQITLSPRYPRGDVRNYQRVQELGQALHDAKVNA